MIEYHRHLVESKSTGNAALRAAAIMYAHTVALSDNGGLGGFSLVRSLGDAPDVDWYTYLLYVAEELADQGL